MNSFRAEVGVILFSKRCDAGFIVLPPTAAAMEAQRVDVLHTGALSFEAARKECVKAGGDIATATTAQAIADLLAVAHEAGITYVVWEMISVSLVLACYYST